MTYKIGDVIRGKVTGIQKYGIFIALDQKNQGLVHISECRHGFMNNLWEFVEIGQELEAKIIDIDEYTKKISLSMRALQPNPFSNQPFVKKKKQRHRQLPAIGFATLEKQLPTWIEEAKGTFLDSNKQIVQTKE